mgnify:CR=1 FL=1
MKILQLVPAMEQGGVERGVLEMNRALVAAGLVRQLRVVAEPGEQMLPARFLPAGLKKPDYNANSTLTTRPRQLSSCRLTETASYSLS